MNKIIKQAAAVLAASVLATPAFATPITFDLTWSGAEFDNTASATGVITIDTDAFTVGYNASALASVSALNVTTIDSSGTSRSYSLSDFGLVEVESPFTLDFTRQLVGQQGNGYTFGGAPYGVIGDLATDFEIGTGTGSGPTAQSYFVLNTSGYSGDSMRLTSMIADTALMPSASAVPEPASITMMLAGFGLVGFAARRRNERS